MSTENIIAPELQQSVRWAERYVSSALNRKLAGILQPGVYHGFIVTPGTGLRVQVLNNPEEYPLSVAVVDRDGWSITVTMSDGGEVAIPGAGTWYIVIEAYYSPFDKGYQRIVAKAAYEKHHIVIAKVTVADGATAITQDDISFEENTIQDREINVALSRLTLALEATNDWQTYTTTTTADIAENGTLTLPDSMEYQTGLHLLSVSWDGLVCYEGLQFKEVVASGAETSKRIQFLFPVPKGSELHIVRRGYCDLSDVQLVTDYTDILSQIKQLQVRLGELENNVAYIGVDTGSTGNA